ncbi:MAG: class I SAM-dependent methyltransferase, partial [Candidatus Latescibacterota bacterium]
MKLGQKHIATEQLAFEDIVRDFAGKKEWVRTVLSRVARVAPLEKQAKILDVGAASGCVVAACNQLGYHCEGVEPWDDARENARRLGEYLDVPIRIDVGSAENLPYDDESFDLVIASFVLEHVLDVDKALSEINRVLKKGGAFWFSSVSSLCPVQPEIRGFPL